jgi:CBS domain-containing protein
MRHSIMTEKIARRGVRVPSDYAADYLDQVWVSVVSSKTVIALSAADSVGDVRAWLAAGGRETRHHAFPVLSEDGELRGVLTRHDILEDAHELATPVGRLLRRPLAVAFDSSSLREAADLMVREGVGRLPVVTRAEPTRLIGILTRSDLLAAHAQRLEDNWQRQPPLELPFVRLARLAKSAGASLAK